VWRETGGKPNGLAKPEIKRKSERRLGDTWQLAGVLVYPSG